MIGVSTHYTFIIYTTIFDNFNIAKKPNYVKFFLFFKNRVKKPKPKC